MNDNPHETARLLLANAASILMKTTAPCGPNVSDMQAAIEIMEIAKTLGADENRIAQLGKVDEVLGWWGTGKGRVETIRALKEAAP